MTQEGACWKGRNSMYIKAVQSDVVVSLDFHSLNVSKILRR